MSRATSLGGTRRLPLSAGVRRRSRRDLGGLYLGAVAGHQQLRHEPCPAGLMRGADAPPAIAVEVFVEENVVAEVRVLEGALVHAVHRPLTLLVGEEQPREAPGQLIGNLVERRESPRARRALDAEVIAVVVMKLLQRLDDE